MNGQLVIDLFEIGEGGEGFVEDVLARVDRGDVVDVQRAHPRAVLERGEVADRADVLVSARPVAVVVRGRGETTRAARTRRVLETGGTSDDTIVGLLQDEARARAREERRAFPLCDTEGTVDLEYARGIGDGLVWDVFFSVVNGRAMSSSTSVDGVRDSTLP